MLFIQLVSMNVFYSIWRVEVIVFYIKVYCETEVFSIAMLLLSLEQVFWEKSVFYIISTIIVPRVDAGGWQCCQCSTPKWLTLISMVEFSFLKMLWTRLSNLNKSSSGWHCSETLKSFGGYNFSCYPVFNTIRYSVQCTKCASLFFCN